MARAEQQVVGPVMRQVAAAALARLTFKLLPLPQQVAQQASEQWEQALHSTRGVASLEEQ